MTGDSLPAELLSCVEDLLARRCGLVRGRMSDYKLSVAIRRAADGARAASAEDFVQTLVSGVDLERKALQFLVREVTVGESMFFRHPEDLAWLGSEVLPALVARREAAGERRLRLWSAGCSTGEEAYTLAALALQAVPRPGAWEVQVLATDINTAGLGIAREARYRNWSFRGVPPETRALWFEAVDEDRWTPREALRRVVRFAYLNLQDPIYPSVFSHTTQLDVIVCRNVFIYWFPDRIREVLGRFGACLRADGQLLCGPSDLMHIQIPGLFEAASGSQFIHRLRRVDGTRSVVAPLARKNGGPHLRRARSTRPRRKPARRPGAAGVKHGSLAAERAAAPSEFATDRDPLWSLLSQGRYTETIAAADGRLAREGLCAGLLHCRALALSALEDPGAVDAWRKVIYLAPSDPEVHLGLAFALKMDGRAGDARSHFQAVCRLLEGRDAAERLPGPNGLGVGWVRDAAASLARPREHD